MYIYTLIAHHIELIYVKNEELIYKILYLFFVCFFSTDCLRKKRKLLDELTFLMNTTYVVFVTCLIMCLMETV